MAQRILTIILLIGLFFGTITLGNAVSAWRLPDIEKGYAPVQPIDYSHRLHAGELQIDCRFCHTGSDQSRHAGIPANDVCMKCHHVITDSYENLQAEANLADKEGRPPKRTVSPELRKLYDAMGLDESLKAMPGTSPQSIPWVKVHDLPDYVYFNHQAHTTVGISCQHCHGPVESMERIQQYETLSMGWCVNCHRDATKNGIEGRVVNAKTDCAVCHY